MRVCLLISTEVSGFMKHYLPSKIKRQSACNAGRRSGLKPFPPLYTVLIYNARRLLRPNARQTWTIIGIILPCSDCECRRIFGQATHLNIAIAGIPPNRSQECGILLKIGVQWYLWPRETPVAVLMELTIARRESLSTSMVPRSGVEWGQSL